MTDLSKKVQQSLKLLQSAGRQAEAIGQPLEIAYSGGKDSDVILQLARMSGVNYQAIYKNTTIDPPGTISHVRQNGVEIYQPRMNFRSILAKIGIPTRWRRFCCSILKEYKIYDHAVIGVRREESWARRDRYKEPEQCRVYNKTKGLIVHQYFPILYWTNDNLAEFIAAEHIQCHSLYYDAAGCFQPSHRLGCLCCPMQTRKRRIEEFKKHPGMVRLYLRGAQSYFNDHPDGKMTQTWKANAYDYLAFYIFCENITEYKQRMGATLFDDGIDTRQFLQDFFQISL